MKRKAFLKQAFWMSGVATLSPYLLSAATPMQTPPPLDSKIVQEFVRVSHGKLDQVKTLLAEHPTLLNSAWDWGGGDFETALGAASHVGHKVLAQYLLDQGAQANIFTACLFGKIDIIKPMVEAFPSILGAKGPHGFTLLHHAKKGGEEALEVKEFLESRGAVETKISLY